MTATNPRRSLCHSSARRSLVPYDEAWTLLCKFYYDKLYFMSLLLIPSIAMMCGSKDCGICPTTFSRFTLSYPLLMFWGVDWETARSVTPFSCSDPSIIVYRSDMRIAGLWDQNPISPALQYSVPNVCHAAWLKVSWILNFYFNLVPWLKVYVWIEGPRNPLLYSLLASPLSSTSSL